MTATGTVITAKGAIGLAQRQTRGRRSQREIADEISQPVGQDEPIERQVRRSELRDPLLPLVLSWSSSSTAPPSRR